MEAAAVLTLSRLRQFRFVFQRELFSFFKVAGGFRDSVAADGIE